MEFIDINTWIYQVFQYLSLIQLNNPIKPICRHDKVAFYSSFLTENALKWYMLLKSGIMPETWDDNKNAIMIELRPNDHDRRARENFQLMQTSSVWKYVSDFIDIIVAIVDISAGEKVDRFTERLKDWTLGSTTGGNEITSGHLQKRHSYFPSRDRDIYRASYTFVSSTEKTFPLLFPAFQYPIRWRSENYNRHSVSRIFNSGSASRSCETTAETTFTAKGAVRGSGEGRNGNETKFLPYKRIITTRWRARTPTMLRIQETNKYTKRGIKNHSRCGF